MKNSKSESLPVVFLKVKGNHAKELRKDEYIWYAHYEKILGVTVVFIQVEPADNPKEKKLFTDVTSLYLKKKGLVVRDAEYHDDALALKKYLKLE